jgi:hypothetical protein
MTSRNRSAVFGAKMGASLSLMGTIGASRRLALASIRFLSKSISTDWIDMTSPYKAVFLLPLGTDKRLGDCGWEFSSRKRLPRTLLLSLANTLHLHKKESYLGMEVYEGGGLKLTAATDTSGIEHIFVQIWARPNEDFVEKWSRRKADVARAVARDEVEVFTPAD